MEYSSGKPDLSKLFQFEVVGILDSDGIDLAYHENRLFISTWPTSGQAGIWMSPKIPEEGGLTTEDVRPGLWTKVWKASDYEPDRITASTYEGGALASFDGYLYWGTMHVPMVATLLHFMEYGDPDNIEEVFKTEEALKVFLGTYRSISIFRGRNFGTENAEMEVLYGASQLPAFNEETREWEIKNNNMGRPLWGPSGFGNPFNIYTWTMSVFNDELFIGTMDYSYVDMEEMKWILGTYADLPLSTLLANPPVHTFGADLFCISSSDKPAIPESLTGVGNYTNYGIRTMISDDALYLGTANPMNLLTNPDDSLPEGGWELIKLTPKAPYPIVDPLPEVIAECKITLIPPMAMTRKFKTVTATTSDPLTYTTPGEYKVTWIYGDNHGGTATQKQTIILNDCLPPVPDVDPLPDIKGHGIVILTPPTAHDNCAGKITATSDCIFNFYLPGAYTVEWTYDDGHGNITVQKQKVIVELKLGTKNWKKPWLPNPWNWGPIPIVIYGYEGFDPSIIEPESIELGHEGITEKVKPSYWYYNDLIPRYFGKRSVDQGLSLSNNDGYKDLVVIFNPREIITKLQLAEMLGETVSFTLSGNHNEKNQNIPFESTIEMKINVPWLYLWGLNTSRRQDYRRSNAYFLRELYQLTFLP
ncbi:MAG: hypothetical protein AB1847_21410 [bacterium]